jgi:hypothetical protein
MTSAWTAPGARRAAAIAVALGLLVAAWVRVAAVEPSLVIRPWAGPKNASFDVWNVFVQSHGGETLDEVAVEPVSGQVTFDGGTSIRDLKSEWKVTFVVRVAGPPPRTAVVRVVQKGRVPRAYDVALGGAP